MPRPAIFLLTTLGLALAPNAALAQEESEEVVASVAGDWLVAPEDGRPGCRVLLGQDETIGGYEIAVQPECEAALSDIAEAAAWRFADGGIAFADATRATLVSFAEDETATYTSTTGKPGSRLLLVKAPKGVTQIPNARDMFGNWTLSGTAGEDCVVGLSDEPPPGGEESYGLSLNRDCDASVADLDLASWRVEGINLRLYGSGGDTLSFEPDGKGGFTEQAGETSKGRRLTKEE